MANRITFTFQLHTVHDADIIALLKRTSNKSAFIREKLRGENVTSITGQLDRIERLLKERPIVDTKQTGKALEITAIPQDAHTALQKLKGL